MNNKSPLSIKAGIICEDVRKEENGKFIIIGAFATDIVVQSFPTSLLLTFLLIGEAAEPFDGMIEFRIWYDNVERVQGRGGLKGQVAGGVLLPIPNILLENLASPGTIKFEIKVAGDNWNTVCSIPLRAASG